MGINGEMISSDFVYPPAKGKTCLYFPCANHRNKLLYKLNKFSIGILSIDSNTVLISLHRDLPSDRSVFPTSCALICTSACEMSVKVTFSDIQ